MKVIVFQSIKFIKMKKEVLNATDKQVKDLVKNSNIRNSEKEKEEQKNEAKAEIKKMFLVQTADDRISKAKVFNELVKKCEDLKRVNEDFNIFKASSDDTKCKIELTSVAGYNFSVHNPETFKKVLEVIGADLEQVKQKAENDLLIFDI